MTFLPCSIQSTNAANWNGRKRRMTTMINRTMGILNEEADELGSSAVGSSKFLGIIDECWGKGDERNEQSFGLWVRQFREKAVRESNFWHLCNCLVRVRNGRSATSTAPQPNSKRTQYGQSPINVRNTYNCACFL